MNSNHSLRSIAAPALALAALLGACTSAPRGTYNTVSGREGGQVTTHTPNRDLENSLEMRDIVQVRKDGMLIFQFELVNKLDRALSFQWDVEWRDRSNLVIDYGPAHYRPERLSGRQSKTIKVVAPSPDADSFRLLLGSRDEVR